MQDVVCSKLYFTGRGDKVLNWSVALCELIWSFIYFNGKMTALCHVLKLMMRTMLMPYSFHLTFPYIFPIWKKKMLLKQHRMEAGDTAVEASAAGHTD